MRTLKTFLYAGIAALTMSAMIFAVSCKKSSTTAAETTTSASDQAVAEKSYSDAQTITEDAATTAGTGGAMNYRTTGTGSTGTATITVTTSGSNTIMTINFGSTNQTCHDDRKRRGEIIVTYPTGEWDTVGAVRTITFNNYYQNDNGVAGTKTVTYEGLNASGNPYYNVTINGTITYPTGKTVTVDWNRVRTWISGFTLSGGTTGYPIWTSNIVYSISGSGTMVNSAGQTVDITIPLLTPLIYAWNCEYIEAGEITYVLTSDGKTRTVNFGSNASPTCNNTAQVTLANGTTVTITLP